MIEGMWRIFKMTHFFMSGCKQSSPSGKRKRNWIKWIIFNSGKSCNTCTLGLVYCVLCTVCNWVSILNFTHHSALFSTQVKTGVTPAYYSDGSLWSGHELCSIVATRAAKPNSDSSVDILSILPLGAKTQFKILWVRHKGSLRGKRKFSLAVDQENHWTQNRKCSTYCTGVLRVHVQWHM